MMPPSLSSEGNRLLAAGMYAEAIQSFENALKTDPNEARCLLGLAKAQLAKGTEDAALASLDRLLKVKPDHLEGRSHRGAILARRGDPQGPAEMDAAAKDRRAGFEEHYNYGMYLIGAKKDELAQRELEACIRIEGRDPRPYVEMGNIALRQKNQVAATTHFLKATQFAGPRDAAPFIALARAYRQAKQSGQAATAYQQALQRQPDDALNEEAYLASMEAGEYDSALKIVLLARQRRPDEPKFSQWQENVMAKLKSAPKKAAGSAPVAFEEGDASSVDVEKEMKRASDLLLRNPPTPPHVAKQILAIVDTVLRVAPEHGEALIKAGICKFLLGDWDACEAYGKKALAAATAQNMKVWKSNAELLLLRLEQKRAQKKALEGKGAAAAPKKK